MRRSHLMARVLSSALSAALVLSSLSLPEIARANPLAAAASPFSLPTELGTITSQYVPAANPRAHTAILIQDLHLHYPTQQRILKILNLFQKRGLINGSIAIEGTEGPYNTSPIASYPSGAVKEKLVDYFMRKGELSGDEAFSILRGDGHLLYGVDDSKFYELNRELYRKTLGNRKALGVELKKIQDELVLLKKQHYTGALKKLDQAEAYDISSSETLLREKIDVVEQLKREKGDTPEIRLLQNLIQLDHWMPLLSRLLRQETDLEEVRYIARRLPQFVQLTDTLMTLNQKNSKVQSTIQSADLEEIIRSAVDFYAVALMRDKPLAQHTLSLLKQQEKVILVAGGFHTKGVTEELKKAGMSYVVVTPSVDEVSEDYHDLYERRLNGETVTFPEVARDFHVSLPVSEQSLRVLSNLMTSRGQAVWEYAWRVAQPHASSFWKQFELKKEGMRPWGSFLRLISGHSVVGGSALGPAGSISPFASNSSGTNKYEPRMVRGVNPVMFPKTPSAEFSLVGVESIAAAATLQSQGLIGLAGKILHHVSQEQMSENPLLVNTIQDILIAHGSEWGVPKNTVDDILRHARAGKFDVKKPHKIVISAVKDVADAASKETVLQVNKNIFLRTVNGMKRFFGASEGLGRDALEAGEAIGAGEILEVPSQQPVTVQGESVERIESAIGLHSRYYTLNDVLEGTNAAVGVVEEGVAYKTRGELPANVRLADFSGATSVGVSIHSEGGTLNTLNADDGYAHTLVTSVPSNRRAEFEANPLDPDQPEESFARIQKAWAGRYTPENIEVVLLNREREKEKIAWLTEQGYQVTLIPDGTLMPSIYAAMGGELTPGKLVVVWTTSGAPEAMMGLSIQKSLKAYGAVGGTRLYPRTLLKKGWMGKAGLSDEELQQIQKLNGHAEDLAALDGQLQAMGKFTSSEVGTYRLLRPQSWRQVVQSQKLLTAADVAGEVDGAFTFVTDNKVFGEKGVEPLPSGRQRIRTLRVKEVNGEGKVWVETTEAVASELVDGSAFLADLDHKFIAVRDQNDAPHSPAGGVVANTEFDSYLNAPVKMEDINPDFFRVYDYRAEKNVDDETVEEVITPASAFRFGVAWAQLAKEKADKNNVPKEKRFAILARDARKINRELVDAVTAGLRYAGIRVIDIEATGPNCVTSYSAAIHLYRPLMGVFLTASHVARPNDASPFSKLDFKGKEFKEEIQANRDIDKLILSKLKNGINEAPESELLGGLNQVMDENELPNRVIVDPSLLHRKARKIYEHFKRGQALNNEEVAILNRGILLAFYPKGTLRLNIQVRGVKSQIQDESGEPQSLTTKEIKLTTRSIVEGYIQDPKKLLEQKSPTPGSLKALDVTQETIRLGVLAGRVAMAAEKGRTLYDLARAFESAETPKSVLDAWEQPLGDVKPLQGFTAVVEGSHTPSGAIAAATFEGLGVSVHRLNEDIREIDGLHDADPSIFENLNRLFKKMTETKSDFGVAFDLDGDRGAIVVRLPDGKFIVLPPDNIMAALIPFLKEKGGYGPSELKKERKKGVAIVKDVLGTKGVNDLAEKYKFETFQTDAGYVFLKAKRRTLLAEGYVVPIYAEKSGHAWMDVAGPIENPVVVAVVYAAMAKQYKEGHPESVNPFFDVFQQNTAPYRQSARFQPAIDEKFLKSVSDTPANPTEPKQLLIAKARHAAISKVAKEFAVGKKFQTSAGELVVSKLDLNMDEDQEKGLYRFADISFSQDGVFAGRFVFRASANDPTYVCVFETPLRPGEEMYGDTVNIRFMSILNIVKTWMERPDVKIGSIDVKQLGEHDAKLWQEFSSKLQKSSFSSIRTGLTSLFVMVFSSLMIGQESMHQAVQPSIKADPSHLVLHTFVGIAVAFIAIAAAWFTGLFIKIRNENAAKERATALTEPLQHAGVVPAMQQTESLMAPPSYSLLTLLLRIFPKASDRKAAAEALRRQAQVLIAA